MILLQKWSGRIMSKPLGANVFDQNSTCFDKSIKSKIKIFDFCLEYFGKLILVT